MERISIDIENLSFEYDKRAAVLDGITFSAAEGESVGIIGANGVGKSTLLSLIVGLETDYSGSIKVGELEVNKKNLARIREMAGFVFQDPENQLFMSTVGEDVAFGPRNYGFAEKEVEERVECALKSAGIKHLKDRRTYQLSSGEKKLASIAAILSMEPDIILMDEPTTALDPRNRRNLIRLLNDFNYLKLITSHDLDFIWDTCERTILMNNGRIVCDGPTEEILRDKELLEANGMELPLSLTER